MPNALGKNGRVPAREWQVCTMIWTITEYWFLMFNQQLPMNLSDHSLKILLRRGIIILKLSLIYASTTTPTCTMFRESPIDFWSKAHIQYIVWLQYRPTEKEAFSVETEVCTWTSTYYCQYRTCYRASAGTLPTTGFAWYATDSSVWRENHCSKVCLLVVFCVVIREFLHTGHWYLATWISIIRKRFWLARVDDWREASTGQPVLTTSGYLTSTISGVDSNCSYMLQSSRSRDVYCG